VALDAHEGVDPNILGDINVVLDGLFKSKKHTVTKPVEGNRHTFNTKSKICENYASAAAETACPGFGTLHVREAFQRARATRLNSLVLERSLARRYLIERDYHSRQLLFYNLCVAFTSHQSLSSFLSTLKETEKIKHPRLRMDRLTNISSSKYRQGRKVGLLMEKGHKPLSRPYSNRVHEAGVEMMLNWLDSRCVCGWAAGVVRDRIVSGEVISLPRLLRDSGVRDLWAAWKSDNDGGLSPLFLRIKKGNRPGYGTFCFLCEIVTVEVTSSNCLSYYFTKNEDAFKLYGELAGLTADIGRRCLDALDDRNAALPISNMATTNFKLRKIKQESEEVLKFSKYEFPNHAVVSGHCADGLHCGTYALGGGCGVSGWGAAQAGKMHKA